MGVVQSESSGFRDDRPALHGAAAGGREVAAGLETADQGKITALQVREHGLLPHTIPSPARGIGSRKVIAQPAEVNFQQAPSAQVAAQDVEFDQRAGVVGRHAAWDGRRSRSEHRGRETGTTCCAQRWEA